MRIERGEVYWVNFDPSVGGEIQKTRPAIIVSNNSANTALNRVQVVPVTSNVDRIYPGEALVDLRPEKRKAMASQIATVSKTWLGNKLAKVGSQDMELVASAIRIQLSL
jgi:mRNA interferase MazF